MHTPCSENLSSERFQALHLVVRRAAKSQMSLRDVAFGDISAVTSASRFMHPEPALLPNLTPLQGGAELFAARGGSPEFRGGGSPEFRQTRKNKTNTSAVASNGSTMTAPLDPETLRTSTSRVARLDSRGYGEVDRDDEGRQIYTALAYRYEETDTYNTTLARGAMAHVRAEDFRILEYHKSDRDPVGKPLSVSETPEGPVVSFVFADTERARELQGLVDGGFLRAVSVGFIPTDGYTREDGVIVYTRADLHELSLVNTPASKGALISLARDMHADATEMAELLGIDIDALSVENDDRAIDAHPAALHAANANTEANDATVDASAEASDDERRDAAITALRDLGVDPAILAQLTPNQAATVDGASARKALALIRRTRG
jgi:HK97 family phage prohead protease